MLKNIIKLLKKSLFKRYFIFGFLIPPILILLCNIGTLFQIPNMLSLFPELISYLSNKSDNYISANFFLSHFAIFIVYFTLVQFSLSKQNIPVEIIRKYLLYNDFTRLFLGLQIGISVVFASFSFCSNLANLNIIICYILFLMNIQCIILFFYWIIENTTHSSLFYFAIQEFSSLELYRKHFENKNMHGPYSKKYKIFWDKKTIKNGSKVVYIKTSNWGIVKNIDIEKIQKILDPYENVIEKLILPITFGSILFSINSKVKSDNLISISLKLQENEETDKILKELLEKLRSTDFIEELKKCIKIENCSTFENNIEIFRDLLDLIIYSKEISNVEIENIIRYIQIKFESLLKLEIEFPKKNEITVTEFYISLLMYFNYAIIKKNYDEFNYEVFYEFIKYFGKIGALKKNYEISNYCNTIILNIHKKTIENSNYQISTIICPFTYINECVLEPILDIETTIDDFCRVWQEYYSPILKNIISSVFVLYQQKIDSTIFIDDDNIKNEINNYIEEIKDFIDFYDGWYSFEQYSKLVTEEYRKNKEIFCKTYLCGIFVVSIYSFVKYYEQSDKRNLIKISAFELCFKCVQIEMQLLNTTTFLTELFISMDSVTVILEKYLDKEIMKLYPSIDTIMLEQFWLCYSYFCYSKTKKYFPNSYEIIVAKDNIKKNRLLRYYDSICKSDYTKISEIFCVENYKIRDFIDKISIYYINILNDIR